MAVGYSAAATVRANTASSVHSRGAVPCPCKQPRLQTSGPQHAPAHRSLGQAASAAQHCCTMHLAPTAPLRCSGCKAIRHPAGSGGHLCPADRQHALCLAGRWRSDRPCRAGDALRAATCAGPTRPREQASPRIEAGTSVPCQPPGGRPGSHDASSPSRRQAPGDLQPQGALHACSQPGRGPVP